MVRYWMDNSYEIQPSSFRCNLLSKCFSIDNESNNNLDYTCVKNLNESLDSNSVEVEFQVKNKVHVNLLTPKTSFSLHPHPYPLPNPSSPLPIPRANLGDLANLLPDFEETFPNPSTKNQEVEVEYPNPDQNSSLNSPKSLSVNPPSKTEMEDNLRGLTENTHLTELIQENRTRRQKQLPSFLGKKMEGTKHLVQRMEHWLNYRVLDKT